MIFPERNQAWVPQVDPPEETPIAPVDVSTFRMPGAAEPGARRVVHVEGLLPYRSSSALCVEAGIEDKGDDR